jgi:cytochrome c-type biogenesis protein CcmH
VDFIVARYGAFVLLKPPFTLHTLLLWLAPALLLGGGLLVAYFSLWPRRKDEDDPSALLTPHEEAQLDEILRERH